MNLEPGQVFAKDFQIERRLSQGGMGAVYVARQLSTDKLRALKVMLPSLLPDAKSRRRFVEEARIGGRIDSEHVVEVVAAGLDDTSGAPWLAMELLDGEDLGALTARRGGLPVGEVREVFMQVAHALGAAHAQGIVHRDLKPENLFLARTRRLGQASVVKVLDFGIALAVPSGGMGVVTTAVGSPFWMAPEQSRPGDAVLPSTDVWALGLIAFHLLVGRSYWRTARLDDASISAVLTEILVEPLEPASARAAWLGAGERLPAGFDAWFARCVTRTVSERFADATAALSELDVLLAPLAARAPVEFSKAEVVVEAAGLDQTFQRATPGLPLAVQQTAGSRLEGMRAESAARPPTPAPVVPPSPSVPAPVPPSPSAHAPVTPRQRFPVGFAVGLAGLALAAFAWWGRQPAPATPTSSPQPVALVAQPGDVAAPVPTAPVPTAPVPTAPAPTAPAPTAPVPTAPVPTAPVPTVPTAPRPRPVIAPAKPAAPSPGTLSVIASEPSSVTVDGAKVGQTPLELPLAPGTHVVVVSNAAQKFSERYELPIASDRMTPLMVTITPPPPDHYVVKGRIDSKTYEFDALSHDELKATCLQWFAKAFPKRGPTKMTANGSEWPKESSPMPDYAVCSYVVKNSYRVPGKRP